MSRRMSGLLCLGLLLAASVPVLRAQGAAPVSATLFTRMVGWNITPNTFLTVELHDAAGPIRAVGAGLSDANGDVTVSLSAVNPTVLGAAYLQPGDQVRLDPLAGGGITVTVPALTVDGDADSDRIVGHAPAGALVTLVLNSSIWQNPITRTVNADAGGNFSLDLTGTADLVPGGTGEARYVDAGGNRWAAVLNVLDAEMTLGESQLVGYATPGLRLNLKAAAAGGVSRGTADTLVLGDGAFSLPDPTTGPAAFGELRAGDRVTLTLTGSPLGSPRVLAWTVPNLSIQLNVGSNSVAGIGPAGSQVRIELISPADDLTFRTVTVAPNGTFQQNLAGIVTLGAGWKAAVRLSPPGATGIYVRALGIAPRVQVGIDSNLVTGTVNPSSLVTVTLSTAAMTPKAQAVTESDQAGGFRVEFFDGAGNPVASLPGDVVEVAGLGSPIQATVPNFTALTDRSTNVVSGRAMPGAQVEVSYGAGDERVSQMATVDVAGNYQTNMTSLVDIEPPDDGRVDIRTTGEMDYFIGWAAVRLTIDTTNGTVSGNGAPRRAVQVTLKASGQTLATAAGHVEVPFSEAEPATWSLDLRDATGAQVPMRTGDVVEAKVGDDQLSVTIPEVTASATPTTDVVTGRTSPNAALTIQIQRLGGETSDPVPSIADGAGDFTRSFSGNFDIKYNDTLLLTALVNRQAVVRSIPVQGLQLQMDPGRLTGVTQPNTDLKVELRSASTILAVATVRSNADGRFQTAWFTSGSPVLPVKGNLIIVTKADVGGELLRMTVPELSVSGDATANGVEGRATPGGSLSIGVFDTFPHSENLAFMTIQPVINAGGTFLTSLGRDYKLQPGAEISALYQAPDGQATTVTRYVAILNVQHGGSRVCGFAKPDDTVTAGLIVGTATPTVSDTGKAAWNSEYRLLLKNAAGTPVPSAAGNAVRAQLGVIPAEVTLPNLAAHVDWDAGRIAGTGPGGTDFTVVSPVHDCFSSADWQTTRVVAGTTALAVGTFSANLPPYDPGDGIELAFFTAQGHRYYRQFYRTFAQMFVDTPRLAGRVDPLAAITFTLRTSGGAERARANLTADSDGAFSGQLKNGTGQTVAMAATDRLTLQAADGSAIVVLSPLALTSAPGTDIQGSAPPGYAVRLDLTLRDGRILKLHTTADPDGKVRFAAADVPPRGGWTLADVVYLRLVLPTADGHELIAESITLPTSTPTPIPTDGPTPIPSATPPPSPTPTQGTPGVPTATPAQSATPTRTSTIEPTGTRPPTAKPTSEGKLWIFMPRVVKGR